MGTDENRLYLRLQTLQMVYGDLYSGQESVQIGLRGMVKGRSSKATHCKVLFR